MTVGLIIRKITRTFGKSCLADLGNSAMLGLISRLDPKAESDSLYAP